jgi:hypothetical protein
MVPGAWAYQLPAEPETPYPLSVWHRAHFRVEDLPSKLHLLVDGFAGSAWRLFVNGQAVCAEPIRSAFDSQIRALDIRDLVHIGDNVISLCLTLTKATDGLLDLLKLVGDFSLVRASEEWRLAARRTRVEPNSWTEQGYPFFSGRATYRRRVQIPEEYANCRVFLEATMADDVLDVRVNGQAAGVRLWDSYRVEVTDLLHPGENVLELTVANTLINLLEGVTRPSGLSGPPSLIPYRRFSFDLGNGDGLP